MKKILSFIAVITFLCLICGCQSTVDQYNVTFKDYDGTILREEIIQETYSATAPNDPVREGYKFVGWDCDFTNVKNNLEINAKYEALTYTISYELNGGTNVDTNPTTYTVEDAFTLEKATKDDSIFCGWFANDELTGEPVKEFPASFTENITLYAKWISTNVEGYTIEDNGTGITIVSADKTIITGDVVIPETFGGIAVTKIGNGAFTANKTITSVKIPDTVTNIGSSAFSSCSNLTSIELPNSVKRVDNYGFAFCDNLKTVKIGSGLHTFDSNVFYLSCAIEKYEVDENNKTFKAIDGNLYYVYQGKLRLINYAVGKKDDTFVVPDGVELIYLVSCAGAGNLKTVVIADGVKSIGMLAFAYCSKLETVIIPDSVETIGGNAFVGCPKLTIYCEAEQKPEKWKDDWNCGRPVIWGYVAEAE